MQLQMLSSGDIQATFLHNREAVLQCASVLVYRMPRTQNACVCVSVRVSPEHHGRHARASPQTCLNGSLCV